MKRNPTNRTSIESLAIEMKISTILYSLILSKYAVASRLEEQEAEVEPKREEPNFVNLDVSYEIVEKPSINFASPVEFTVDEVATFNFTFQNNEDTNVTVVGLSGNVIDALGGYEVANITAQELGPFGVSANGSIQFQSPIQLTLPEGSFYLAPLLFVLKDEELMKVGIRPLSIYISPPPMSFFNPSFLSVQILLALIVIAVTYSIVNIKKQGVKGTTKGPQQKQTLEGWLPETHKK